MGITSPFCRGYTIRNPGYLQCFHNPSLRSLTSSAYRSERSAYMWLKYLKSIFIMMHYQRYLLTTILQVTFLTNSYLALIKNYYTQFPQKCQVNMKKLHYY